MVIQLCLTSVYWWLLSSKRKAKQRTLTAHYQSVVLVWLISAFLLDFYFIISELKSPSHWIRRFLRLCGLPKQEEYRSKKQGGGLGEILDIIRDIIAYDFMISSNRQTSNNQVIRKNLSCKNDKFPLFIRFIQNHISKLVC